jgi:hypothetical protein
MAFRRLRISKDYKSMETRAGWIRKEKLAGHQTFDVQIVNVKNETLRWLVWLSW